MLSKRIQNITPSVTVALAGQVTELQRQGVDIISFGVGEPDFGTPENISTAGKAAIDNNFTKYTAVSGILPLREAICEKLLRDNDVRYSSDQISVGTGAKQPLFNSVQALIDNGDEVLLPTPCWVSYVEMVKLVGGIPVCVPCKSDYQLDVDAIRAAVTEKTAAIIINSPNNPTGAVYGQESLQAIADLAVEKDLYVIADEIYEKLLYGDCRHVSIASLSPEIYQRTIVINGMSKAYRMTGWRIGYSAAPADIAKGISGLQGHMTSNSTTLVQWSAIEALENGEPDVQDMVAQFVQRRDYAYERAINLPHVTCTKPDGAFYLMPDVSWYYGKRAGDRVISDSFAMSEYLLQEYHVAVVPGGAFMAPEAIRIAYTNSLFEIQRGFDRIETALNALQ